MGLHLLVACSDPDPQGGNHAEGSSFTGHGNLGGLQCKWDSWVCRRYGRGGLEACLNRELKDYQGRGLLNCPSPPGGPWRAPVAQEGEGLWTWSRCFVWHILPPAPSQRSVNKEVRPGLACTQL